MRHIHRITRVSKSLASTNRPFSSEGQTLAQNSVPRAGDAATASTKTFPADNSIFSEHPLIFDTHKMVSYLQAGGFTPAQSEALTNTMVHVSQHANRHHSRLMVTKNEFVSLRSELSILEKADFALLKTDINAIEKRMETSVAEIYTAVERVENRVIKWVIAVAGAIGLAIVRLTGPPSGSGGHRIVPAPPPANVAQQELPRVCRRNGLEILLT